MAGGTREGVGGGQAVRIILLNTGGLNAKVKCTKIMTHVTIFNKDIMILQETHLHKSHLQKLNRPWIGKIFHSKFNLKTRGTVILIRSGIDFTPDGIITDSYVIVSGAKQLSMYLYMPPIGMTSPL